MIIERSPHYNPNLNKVKNSELPTNNLTKRIQLKQTQKSFLFGDGLRV